ncbi:hypothetical protein NUW58_g5525 [Xylaria curta]|uniref:Uncharacterized protein n=1 Tax=Xylaria curta TaxID=42375 RepID=A0ACC1P3V9_9PEZI|nr:hypothetical protein NUW58_g5525 [Xylaria curta]
MPAETATPEAIAQEAPQGMRKNGKQWHAPRKAFRPTAGLTSYEQREKRRLAMAVTKAKEKEMKEEKEAERQQRIQKIKDKRAAKEEKERYAKMAEKMHKKRVAHAIKDAISGLFTPAAAAYPRTMSAKHHDPLAAERVVTSPNRPNHQLRRSITEQSPPFRQSRVHQYLLRKDRERDDRLLLSAGLLVRGSLELSRATPLTLAGITTTGMVSSTGDGVANTDESRTNLQRPPSNRDIARQHKEKAAAATATASLRKSLVDLNTFSNATIARLDDTYSSVLQRLGSLQNTVAAMKELAVMSQEINKSFTNESRALVSEIESQLSLCDQSADQKKRIQELQARIHAGRDKVQALSKRVDAVRGRIEGWEKANNEWQERTRRRLKAIWIIISIVAFVLMLLLVGAQYAPSSTDHHNPPELAQGIQEGKPPMGSLLGNNSKSAVAMADEVRQELTRNRAPLADQGVLRVFDEL